MATPVVLIPGDGIGPEVTTAMQAVLAAAGADVSWVEAVGRPGRRRTLRRPAAAGNPRPHPPLPRRPQGAAHHPGRQGLPFHQRPPPQGTRPVCQHPAVAQPARRADALQRRRSRRRPREYRGLIFGTGARRRARRGGEPAHHHQGGVRTHRPLRLRAGPQHGPAARHLLPQSGCHADERRPFSGDGAGRGRRLPVHRVRGDPRRYGSVCSWRSTRRRIRCW